ncbi:MAG TPA: MoaD/ThiS family protein [Nocardioidaceae bacterium]|nr:MoaD/ThiS family protein [Nocardioidaceae bacterium]
MTTRENLMQVTVTLKGHLAQGRVADGDERVDLADGAVAADLAAACGVDPRACVVVLNGAAVPRGTALSDGDRAQLYPAQAGG